MRRSAWGRPIARVEATDRFIMATSARIEMAARAPIVAPALESLVFAVEPGRILPMTAVGEWPVVDEPPAPDKLKPAQIRRPNQPSGRNDYTNARKN